MTKKWGEDLHRLNYMNTPRSRQAVETLADFFRCKLTEGLINALQEYIDSDELQAEFKKNLKFYLNIDNAVESVRFEATGHNILRRQFEFLDNHRLDLKVREVSSFFRMLFVFLADKKRKLIEDPQVTELVNKIKNAGIEIADFRMIGDSIAILIPWKQD